MYGKLRDYKRFYFCKHIFYGKDEKNGLNNENKRSPTLLLNALISLAMIEGIVHQFEYCDVCQFINMARENWVIFCCSVAKRKHCDASTIDVTLSKSLFIN